MTDSVGSTLPVLSQDMLVCNISHEMLDKWPLYTGLDGDD